MIVLLGEIGGGTEIAAAEFIAGHGKKPVVSLIVGRSAPEGTSLGHAGAIIHGSRATAQSKIDALSAAGVAVASTPAEVVRMVKRFL